MKTLIAIAIIICPLIMAGCVTNLTDAGPGSETTNGKALAGVAILPDGTPAALAKIFIRPVNFLPDTSNIGVTINPDTVALTNGKFSCSVPDSGSYVIEVNYQNRYAVAFRTDSLAAGNLGQLTLVQSAGFFGTIDRRGVAAGNAIYVQVYGTDRQCRVDSNGSFSILGLPPGEQVTHVRANNVSYGIIDKDTVELFPAENRDMGTYVMPFNGWGDTLIVREILDSNGLFSIGTARVIRWNDKNRVDFLDLMNFGITKLPASVTRLPLRHLRIGDNKLTQLPQEIGRIATLAELNVKNNALTKIPASIGTLTHLQNLDISQNKLTVLPSELTALTQLDKLFVDDNSLTIVNEPVLTWLNTYSSNPRWAATQR